jgi:hypothetical protein
MLNEINFVARDSLADIANMAGLSEGVSMARACPFLPGDMLSFPAAPALFFKVMWRLFQPVEDGLGGHWLVALDQCPDPLSTLESAAG